MIDKRHKPTETYMFHNVNPKGYLTNDCIARAVTLATGLSYEEVVMGIAKKQVELCRHDKEDCDAFLNSIGWNKQKQPRKPNGKKYTIDEFCKEIAEPNKKYVVSCAGHLTCVVDKKIHDIWNCGQKSVGNYWIKGK